MGDTEEQHLVCSECDDNVTVARTDSQARLVCHCTHVDGPIDPTELSPVVVTPDRWRWV